MAAQLNSDGCIKWKAYASIATEGYNVALTQDYIDAQLAAHTGNPDYVLCNLGANDATGTVNETTWKADYQYIIDAVHTKWPNAKIYLAKAWRRNYTTNCNTLAGYIDDLVAANPGVCFAGHDERVWMENSDDGATMTTEGTHYSPTGVAELLNQWETVLGD